MERLIEVNEKGVTHIRYPDQAERIINKLREYEDLEEAGLLLRLKLKIGDVFWELNRAGNGEPYAYPRTSHTLQHVIYCMDHLGKNTFLTAEEALKKIKGEEHE